MANIFEKIAGYDLLESKLGFNEAMNSALSKLLEDAGIMLSMLRARDERIKKISAENVELHQTLSDLGRDILGLCTDKYDLQKEIVRLNDFIDHRDSVCTYCGRRVEYRISVPGDHERAIKEINEHALTCEKDPNVIEVKRLRTQLDIASHMANFGGEAGIRHINEIHELQEKNANLKERLKETRIAHGKCIRERDELVDRLNKKFCAWVHDPDNDTWTCSKCHGEWVWDDGTPIESGYKYCPGCGCLIEFDEKDGDKPGGS